MEFVERIPLIKAHYLLSLSFKDYKPFDKSSSKNENERKENWNKMRNYCENIIKANGTIKRLYKYTGDKSWNPDSTGSGRLFAVNGGIQGLSKIIRGFLLDGITFDIDMVNAHPVILRYLCNKHNLECEQLNYYIENRDEVLQQFENREVGKTMFLKATNNDKINKKERNLVFRAYDKEMKNIQKSLTQLTCYKNIVADVPSNKLYNWNGSAMNRILCFYENNILQVIIDELNKLNYEICAPMFDGCMPYGQPTDDLLETLETAINDKFVGLKMKLSFKDHCQIIQMPEDFEIPQQKPSADEINSFEKVSEEFEKNHCKIINRAVFVKQLECGNVVLNKQQIKTSYEHLVYEKINKDGDVVIDNFINSWMNNNPSQRCYDDIGVYPDETLCPNNHFNLWRKFQMEYITDFEIKNDELQFVLNHIKILCGNDDKVFDYFIKWIGQMIQYPAVKSICPTIISKQGAGKGSLLKLLTKMLGDDKVFETTNPSRDVWGDFNGRMCNTFLINLNELSKKETLECEGKIKGLITDPKLTINNKGLNQYDIQSYHRFLITTNVREPINTSKDDRRNLIMRSSDEKCGDKEYFNKLHELLDDVNVIKTCYEYFKSIPDLDKFNSIPIPETEYQTNLKELSVTPIEQWLHDFTLENSDKDNVELLGSETLNLFNDWCNKNSVDYKISSTKLGVRLSNLNINGIEKGKHTNKGWTKIFNINSLKKHFNIGLLIKIKESNDDILDE